jgi:flagellar hook-length control protein FliK
MNAPSPVSALNIMARPEQSASSAAGSANDSGASFSRTLENQKKSMAEHENHARTSRTREDANVQAKQNSAHQRSEEAAQNKQQESDRLAKNEQTEKSNLTDTERQEENTDNRAHQEGDPKQAIASAQTKITLEPITQSLQAQLGEKNKGETALNSATHTQKLNIEPAEGQKTQRFSVGSADAQAFEANARKTKATDSFDQTNDINETITHNRNGREPGSLSSQAPATIAGAAIAKASGAAVAAQSAQVNSRVESDALIGQQLKKIETNFNRSDATSAFLERVVDARRISGQKVLQNALHSEIANTTDRQPAGFEAIPGLAAVNTQNTAFSLGSATVPTPLGHAEWGRDFSQQVSSFSQHLRNGLQTIELRLDPPDLGPIRISLSMADNVAQASFVSPHAAVRQAVEQALPQLQEQLAQAGISLGQTSVGEQHQQGAQHAAGQTPKTAAPIMGK